MLKSVGLSAPLSAVVTMPDSQSGKLCSISWASDGQPSLNWWLPSFWGGEGKAVTEMREISATVKCWAY